MEKESIFKYTSAQQLIYFFALAKQLLSDSNDRRNTENLTQVILFNEQLPVKRESGILDELSSDFQLHFKLSKELMPPVRVKILVEGAFVVLHSFGSLKKISLPQGYAAISRYSDSITATIFWWKTKGSI